MTDAELEQIQVKKDREDKRNFLLLIAGFVLLLVLGFAAGASATVDHWVHVIGHWIAWLAGVAILAWLFGFMLWPWLEPVWRSLSCKKNSRPDSTKQEPE